MTQPRILVACIGNIFLGDDAFGVAVAQRLGQRSWPEEVRVVDFGIRGLDLTYALMEGYEVVFLVDALPRGGAPGTLYILEPEVGAEEPGPADLKIEPHALDPAKVLRLARALGGSVQEVLLVGCEPTPMAEDEMSGVLSEPVRAAVDVAVVLIEKLVGERLSAERHERKREAKRVQA